MRNDKADATLSVYDDSAATWCPMLNYNYLSGTIDFKSNKIGIGNSSPAHLIDVGTSGAYCDGGAWVDGSSMMFKENVQSLSLDDANRALEGLNSVRYNYKDNKEEEYLGFIAEDVPELVAMKDRKGMHTMDVVIVLTKIVQDQQDKLENQQEQIEKLKEQQEMYIKQKEKIDRQDVIIEELLNRIEELEKEK
ncbi:MAG: tail fiber domain-containing protein [Candidatus Aminicenantaceae bacterium]